jgi:formylglycine-generating enzyme required for sulfatase activity
VARIFLCHASEDKAKVREVYHRLQAIDGFEPWLDEEDLLPGQDWALEIQQALQTSDFILIFLSRNSVAKRGYVQREMKLALDAWQEVPEGAIHTIPVRLDDCDVPESFRRYHWTNLFEPKGFDRIVRAIRAELAKRPATPDSALEPTFTNSIGMEFVLIPAGTFMMGSPDSDTEAWSNEKPIHRVTISKPFYMGKHPVTQGQWAAVMGNNPSRFQGDSNRPVESVSWEEAQEFILKLDAKEGNTKYRLPTEAEWEYAARAGTTTTYSFGDRADQLGEYAWYWGNSSGTTHPIGQKQPNAWGLYDMHGNVWEWVQDWSGGYSAEAATDPQGAPSSAFRLVRGGSCGNGARHCRSACRSSIASSYRFGGLGFRLLRTAQ